MFCDMLVRLSGRLHKKLGIFLRLFVNGTDGRTDRQIDGWTGKTSTETYWMAA